MSVKNKINIFGQLSAKKIIIIALILVLIAVGVTIGVSIHNAQKNNEPSMEEVLEDKLTAYETDLRDSLGSMNSNQDVANYLINWAKNKEIPAVKDEYGNVIFTLKASKEQKEAVPSAIVCGFDHNNMESYIYSMSTALCVAKNAQNHGKINIVFLAESNGEKDGAKGFDIGHFAKNTNVFYLGDSTSSKVSQSTGAYNEFLITHKLKYNKPSYDTAYKITINVGQSQPLSSRINSVPNPIKTLGSVLANLKSTSLLFELSSFYGGKSGNLTPSKASMTIVINSSDTEKLERKLNNSIKKLYDKFGDDYPQLEYTFEEVELPKRVFESDDAENLVSLMYTAFNGVYYKDDNGNVVALTNIGRISNKDSRLSIYISAMSYDPDILTEISETYETICGLCDVKYKCAEEYAGYYGEDISAPLLTAFTEDFLAFTGDSEMNVESSVEYTGCSPLHEKNADLPILYFGITEKTKHKFTGSIVTFLDNGVTE